MNLFEEWTSKEWEGEDVPEEIWTLASRPKLTTATKALTKAREGRPVGRAISFGSTMEQFVGFPLWRPVMDRIQEMGPGISSPVRVGISKWVFSWSHVGRKVERASNTYVGDWSEFDSTIPASVVRYGLDVIDRMFDKSDARTRMYTGWYRAHAEMSLVNSRYRFGEEVDLTSGSGIPSGTIWTSLLGSICNFIMIKEGIERCAPKVDADTLVYGDDHMIMFNKISDRERRHFKRDFLRVVGKRFGLRGGADDCYMTVGSRSRVGFKRPVYDASVKEIEFGTRNLKARSWEFSYTHFEGYDHKLGQSHRWYYDFTNRPKFLS